MTDLWHGTASGYTNHGCRLACCRTAWAKRQAQYRKDRYLRGRLTVSNLGTVRRLQALSALGWTPSELGRRLGTNSSNVAKARAGEYPLVRVTTRDRVAALYRELSMTMPPDTLWSRKTRANALRLGWFPPLAWDDIDDPDELPSLDVLREAS